MISIIAAVGRNWVIGKNNALPWGHLPADMKHFKETTTGHTVVMGSRTWESIGRALPNRRNVVLASDPAFTAPGCEVVHSVDEVLQLAENEEIFICGGGMVYKTFLPNADRLYLTFIDEDFDGDTYFPFQDLSGWKKIDEKIVLPDNSNPYKLTFATFARQ